MKLGAEFLPTFSINLYILAIRTYTGDSVVAKMRANVPVPTVAEFPEYTVVFITTGAPDIPTPKNKTCKQTSGGITNQFELSLPKY